MNKSKRWRETHAERVKTQQKNWRENNPAKRKAHRLLRAAVISGEIVKPEKCITCAATKPLVAHHHDYSKPLDVHWICRSCHAKEHGIAVGVKKNFAKGEAHGSAKLNAVVVGEIRAQLGQVSIRELARYYGVSEKLVRLIKNGEIWKNV